MSDTDDRIDQLPDVDEPIEGPGHLPEDEQSITQLPELEDESLLEALDPPLWQQNRIYPAIVDRQLIESIFPDAGVLGGLDLKVSARAAGVDMSVDVAPGTAVVVGSEMVAQGNYLCRSGEVENLPIASAPGAGLSRLDRIVARVYDDTVAGGGRDEWALEAVTGMPAASPALPPAPPSSYSLASIALDATTAAIAAANITDLRRITGPGRVFFSIDGLNAQSIPPAGVVTKLTTAWAADPAIDVGGGLWANQTYAVPVGGLYRLTLSLAVASSIGATSLFQCLIRRAGGVGNLAFGNTFLIPGLATSIAVASKAVALAAGDAVEFCAINSAQSAAQNTQPYGTQTYAQIERLPVRVS